MKIELTRGFVAIVDEEDFGAYQRDGQTSQYRGVHKRKTGWMARITINQQTKSLGTFRTDVEAHLAYEAARSRIVEVYAYA